MGSGVLSGCSGLSSVSFSSGMSTIPELTFYGCSGLDKISIPGSVGSIGSQAFGSCKGLTSITIPAATSSIELSAFDGCSNLSEISVESGNGSYSSNDGALFNSSQTELLYCPMGKSSLKLPDGMTSISSSAFSECPYLYSLIIPDSVTTIEADAFTGSGIGTVEIPKSVTSIGSQSSWTPDVIYGYSGTEAERFANDNGYIFESRDTPEDDPRPPRPTPPTPPQPTPPDVPGGPNDNPNNDPGGTESTGSVNKTGTSSGTTVRTASSASRNMGTAKVSSGTPKTGIAFDARYALCAGIFLAGACLVISRKRKGIKSE